MLSMNRIAFIALYVAVPAALVVGCVTKQTDTENDINTGTTSSTTTTSSSGDGGSGGSGGQGGSGGASCVGVEGTGQTEAACDALNISPTQGASQQCGATGDQDPPGYLGCKRAYTVFIPGAAEHFTACLATIGVGLACDVEPAQTCLDDTIAATCDDPAIAAACAQIQTDCGGDINQEQCASELRPFSDAGLADLATCMTDELASDPAATCQQAYDTCYQTVLPL